MEKRSVSLEKGFHGYCTHFVDVYLWTVLGGWVAGGAEGEAGGGGWVDGGVFGFEDGEIVVGGVGEEGRGCEEDEKSGWFW